MMTAVVVNGPKGKEYRLPTDLELEVAGVTEDRLRKPSTRIFRSDCQMSRLQSRELERLGPSPWMAMDSTLGASYSHTGSLSLSVPSLK